MNMLKKMLSVLPSILTLLILPAAAAHASQVEKQFDVSDFNTITLAKGLEVHVMCAAHPQIVASASPETMNKLEVKVSNHHLAVTGTTQDYDAWDFSDHKATLKIYTNKPIDNMKIMFGVKLAVDACAVPKDQLTVNGSMGSSFAISGETDKLNADLAMGAKFNDGVNDFKAQSANVSVAMGAEAYLCQVAQVSGSAAMGAIVYLGQHTTNNLDTAMGAMSKSCR
ncbi:GIN domain-containing protein [Brenneria uluponensis]|uniref:GIN domain-containing protein n=1 Tax=Brenneria uluponensis TaxID=3057057 RepID=UPI0028E7872D|nr:DUF2807 domain-containing protein [Brenneria ulupoensis]